MPDPYSGAETREFDDESRMRAECLHPGHCRENRYDLACYTGTLDSLMALLEREREQSAFWKAIVEAGESGDLHRRIRVAISLLSHGRSDAKQLAMKILNGEDIALGGAA